MYIESFSTTTAAAAVAASAVVWSAVPSYIPPPPASASSRLPVPACESRKYVEQTSHTVNTITTSPQTQQTTREMCLLTNQRHVMWCDVV